MPAPATPHHWTAQELLASPEALVAAARAAGFRLERRRGWYNARHRCGCLLGVVAILLHPELAEEAGADVFGTLRGLRLPLGRQAGLIDGFDGHPPPSPDLRPSALTGYDEGYAFGRRVYELACEETVLVREDDGELQ